MLTYSNTILQRHSKDSAVHPFLKWTCTHSHAARISVSNWDVYLDEVVCGSQNITGCMNMGQNTSYIPLISLSLFLSLPPMWDRWQRDRLLHPAGPHSYLLLVLIILLILLFLTRSAPTVTCCCCCCCRRCSWSHIWMIHPHGTTADPTLITSPLTNYREL